MAKKAESADADVNASVAKAVYDEYKPAPGQSTSRSVKQLGSLLSILAVQDVYDAVRPLLVREKILGDKDDARVVRPDLLKALARKWNLHKEPNFWRENDTPLKLAVALVEHDDYISRYRRGRGAALGVVLRSDDGDRDEEESVQAGRKPTGSAKDDITSSLLSHKQNAWSRMAVQHRESERAKPKPVEGRTPVSPRHHKGVLDDRPSVDPLSLLKGTKSLREHMRPYRGDLFSQRGEYSKALVYLSRMPASSDGEAIFTRAGDNLGFRHVRKTSVEGRDGPARGHGDDWHRINATGASVKFAPVAHSSSTGISATGTSSMDLPTKSSSSKTYIPVSMSSLADPDSGVAEISQLLGKVPAGSGSAAASILQLSARDAAYAQSVGKRTVAGGSVREDVLTGMRSVHLASGRGEEDDMDRADAASGLPGGIRPDSLLDAEALEAALSRGAHATTDFNLQLLETTSGARFEDSAQDELQAPTAIPLSLRQQCALALREMSRDHVARPTIIAQGGFRALLQVLVESEGGATVEAEIDAEYTAAKAARDQSVTGDVEEKEAGATSKLNGVGHIPANSRYHMGSMIASESEDTDDASNAATTRPMMDTVMNCLIALCNLSSVESPDTRHTFDTPWGTDPTHLEPAVRTLEPGLVGALASLAPAVSGAARCLIITSLYNFSCNRYMRECLVEEGAVSAALALLTPETVHMKGMSAVPVSLSEQAEAASKLSRLQSMGKLDAYSVASEEDSPDVFSKDEMSEMLTMVSGAAARNNPAGQHVRSKMQQLLRKLVRYHRPASTANIGSGTPAAALEESSDASLVLEDAYCVDVGIRLLCNLSGFPDGADGLLHMNALSTLASEWQWLTHVQRCQIAAHILYNTSRTKLNARYSAESSAVMMLCSVIDSIIFLNREHPCIGETHDFVLRRSILALCRMSLNPQASEHLLWSDGAKVLATASLHLGAKEVVPDATIAEAVRQVAAGQASSVLSGSLNFGCSQAELYEKMLELHDIAVSDMGKSVGIHPGEHFDMPTGLPRAGAGALPGTRYPTVLVHRKIAAAICRLAWGEPPSVVMLAAAAAPSDLGKIQTGNSAVSVQTAAAAGGWEKPSSMTQAAKDVSAPTMAPSSMEATVSEQGLSFEATLEMDRDLERTKRVTVLVCQRHVVQALCRYLFSPDAPTRKISETALCTIMRVPAACTHAINGGALHAIAAAAHLAYHVNPSTPSWKPGHITDGDDTLALDAYAEDHHLLAMSLYNASCHPQVRRLLLHLRVADMHMDSRLAERVEPDTGIQDDSENEMEEIASHGAAGTSYGNTAISNANNAVWMSRFVSSSESITPQTLHGASNERLVQIVTAPDLAAVTNPAVSNTALRWSGPNDSVCMQTDANVLRSAASAQHVLSALQQEAIAMMSLANDIPATALALPSLSTPVTARDAEPEAQVDLPVVHSLLVVMSRSADVIARAMPDVRYMDARSAELLSARQPARGSKPLSRGQRPSSLYVPQQTAEFVQAATALSFGLAALRNLSAEAGYQNRLLCSGVIPVLLAVLSPMQVPTLSPGTLWCPFPLPCVGDAVHIMANLSIDVASRQVMLQSGLLPALLPIASDMPTSALALSLQTSVAQAKLEHIQRKEQEISRQEEYKKNATMAAALNAKGGAPESPPQTTGREGGRASEEAPLLVTERLTSSVEVSIPLTQRDEPAANTDGSTRSISMSPLTSGERAGGFGLLDRRKRRGSIANAEIEGHDLSAPQVPLAFAALVEAINIADADYGVQQRIAELFECGAEARKQCALALSAMAMAGAAKHADRLLGLGVLQALIALAYFGREGDPIRERISAALQALASEEHLAAEMVKQGVISALVSLCGSSSEKVRQQCVGALANLSRQRGYEQIMVDAGVVPALMVIALLRTNDPITQSRCVFSVHNLLASPECRTKVLQQGFVWALQKLALSKDIATQRAVAVCVYRLASDPKSQGMLVRQGGLRSIISVLHKAYGIKVADTMDSTSSLPQLDNTESEPIIIAALREAAAADVDSKVGMTGVNTVPTSTDSGSTVGCDPVVASYFAGVLAAVSRVKGSEEVLIAEGAVEALVVLCSGRESFTGLSEDIGGGHGVEPAETSDISKLRPSCALGLYNMSCASSPKFRGRVIAGGAPAVFMRLASDPSEGLVTRRLCVLGMCNLLWGPGAGPEPLAYAHSPDTSDASMAEAANRRIAATNAITGRENVLPQSHRMLVMRVGVPSALLSFSKNGEAVDWMVAAATLHHISCFEDCHAALTAADGIATLVEFADRLAQYNVAACIRDVQRATASKESVVMRINLDAAFLGVSALANVATHPGSSVKALFALCAAPLDSSSTGASVAWWSSANIRRIVNVCHAACNIVADATQFMATHVTSGAFAASARKPVDSPITRARVQGSSSSPSQIGAGNVEDTSLGPLLADVERASMIIEACQAIFSALAFSPAIQVVQTPGNALQLLPSEHIVSFPYVTAMLQGGVVNAVHHVLVASQLPTAGDGPSARTRLPTVRSFRIGTGGATPTTIITNAGVPSSVQSVLRLPVPRRTVAGAVTVLCSLFAHAHTLDDVASMLRPTGEATELSAQLLVGRIVALGLAATTLPSEDDDRHVNEIAMNKQQLAVIAEGISKTHDLDSGVDDASTESFSTSALVGVKDSHPAVRPLNLAKRITALSPHAHSQSQGEWTFDTARMKSFADPSFAFAEEAAERVRSAYAAIFNAALGREIREGCARILCYMSAKQDLRSTLINSGCPSALIALSKHADTSSHLQRACLRAICQLAIGVDVSSAAPKASGETQAASVISSGAITALISVMETSETPGDGSDAQGSSSYRDILTEYVATDPKDHGTFWYTVNPNDLILHPHSPLLCGLVPEHVWRAAGAVAKVSLQPTSKPSDPGLTKSSSQSSINNSGQVEDDMAAISLLHPSSLNLNGVFNQPGLPSLKRALFAPAGTTAQIACADRCERMYFTPSLTPTSRVALLPLPALHARAYALVALAADPSTGQRSLDTTTVDAAAAGVQAMSAFLIGHHTFLCYEDGRALHEQILDTASNVEREWRADPKRAAVAAAASAESAASYAVSLVRQAASGHDLSKTDSTSTLSGGKSRLSSMPKPHTGCIVPIDGVNVVQGRRLISVDVQAYILDVLKSPSAEKNNGQRGALPLSVSIKVPTAESAAALTQPLQLQESCCPALFTVALVPSVAMVETHLAVFKCDPRTEEPTSHSSSSASATPADNDSAQLDIDAQGQWPKIGRAVASLRDSDGSVWITSRDFMKSAEPSVHAAPVVPSRGNRRASTVFYSASVSASLLTTGLNGGRNTGDRPSHVMYNGTAIEATGLSAVAAFQDMLTMPDTIHDGVGLDEDSSGVGSINSALVYSTPIQVARGPAAVQATGEAWLPDDEDTTFTDGWGRRYGFDPVESISWFDEDVREYQRMMDREEARQGEAADNGAGIPSIRARRLSGVDVTRMLNQISVSGGPGPSQNRRKSLAEALQATRSNNSSALSATEGEFIRVLDDALKRTLRIRWEQPFVAPLPSMLWKDIVLSIDDLLLCSQSLLARVSCRLSQAERKQSSPSALAVILPNASTATLGGTVTLPPSSRHILRPMFPLKVLEDARRQLSIAITDKAERPLVAFMPTAALILANSATHIATHGLLVDINERRLRALAPSTVRRAAGEDRAIEEPDIVSARPEVWGGVSNTARELHDSAHRRLQSDSALVPSESILTLASLLNPPKNEEFDNNSRVRSTADLQSPTAAAGGRRQSVDRTAAPGTHLANGNNSKPAARQGAAQAPRVASLATPSTKLSERKVVPVKDADTTPLPPARPTASPYTSHVRKFKPGDDTAHATAPRPTSKGSRTFVPSSSPYSIAPTRPAVKRANSRKDVAASPTASPTAKQQEPSVMQSQADPGDGST